MNDNGTQRDEAAPADLEAIAKIREELGAVINGNPAIYALCAVADVMAALIIDLAWRNGTNKSGAMEGLRFEAREMRRVIRDTFDAPENRDRLARAAHTPEMDPGDAMMAGARLPANGRNFEDGR